MSQQTQTIGLAVDQDCVKKVQAYQDELRQAVGLSVLPLEQFQASADQTMQIYNDLEEVLPFGRQDLIIKEMLLWFKAEFFSWVNKPPCATCTYADVKYIGNDKPTQDELEYEASRTELYLCPICGSTTRFPRYNDVIKLFETRRGRCGEWANAFGQLLVCVGSTVRLVVDGLDHIWCEYWSITFDRWIHVDSCESAYDSPLMYELGWNKKYIQLTASSLFSTTDVTPRYTCDWPAVQKRRAEKAGHLQGLRGSLQISTPRRLHTPLYQCATSAELEVVQCMESLEDKELDGYISGKPHKGADEEYEGRGSGEAEWIDERGEGGKGGPKRMRGTLYRYGPTTMEPRVPGGIVRACAEHAPHELCLHLFDGNLDSKWLAFVVPAGEGKCNTWAWVDYRVPARDDQVTVVKYDVVSGGDAPERDPCAWVLMTELCSVVYKGEHPKGGVQDGENVNIEGSIGGGSAKSEGDGQSQVELSEQLGYVVVKQDEVGGEEGIVVGGGEGQKVGGIAEQRVGMAQGGGGASSGAGVVESSYLSDLGAKWDDEHGGWVLEADEKLWYIVDYQAGVAFDGRGVSNRFVVKDVKGAKWYRWMITQVQDSEQATCVQVCMLNMYTE